MLNSVGLQGPGVEHWIEHGLPELRATRRARDRVAVGRTVDDFAGRGEDARSRARTSSGSRSTSAARTSRTGARDVRALDPRAPLRSCARCWTPSSGSRCSRSSRRTTRDRRRSRAPRSTPARRAHARQHVARVRHRRENQRPVSARAAADCRVHRSSRSRSARCTTSRALPGDPIIGTGGVTTGEDVVEMLLAGASAVGVGTVTFRDPRAMLRILDELETGARAHGVAGSPTSPGHWRRHDVTTEVPAEVRATAWCSASTSVTSTRPRRSRSGSHRGSGWSRWARALRRSGPGCLRPVARAGLQGLLRPEAPRHPEHRRARRARARAPWRGLLNAHAAGGEAMLRAFVEGRAGARATSVRAARHPRGHGAHVRTGPSAIDARLEVAAPPGATVSCAARARGRVARERARTARDGARHPPRGRDGNDQARVATPGERSRRRRLDRGRGASPAPPIPKGCSRRGEP